MNRDAYADMMRRYFRLAEERALEAILEMFTDDASMSLPLSKEPIVGREGIRAFLTKLFESYTEIRFEILDMIIDVEGQRAATEQRVVLIDHEGNDRGFARNTNHFTFVGERFKMVRAFSGR